MLINNSLFTLIVSALCLVPHQPLSLLGIELLVTGCFIWIVILKIDIKVYKMTNIKYRKQYMRNIIYGQLATLPYIIAGAGILLGGSFYLYLLVPGIIFSFIKAVTDAWVLLIEIHR